MRLNIAAITQAEAPRHYCPTSCPCRCCSPCHATAHSANADPTAAASSHPAATGTANATTPDRYRTDGAHDYAHARV